MISPALRALAAAAAALAPLSLAAQQWDAPVGAAAGRVAPQMVQVRHDLHQHPELSNREFRTAGESLRFSSVSGNVTLRVPASTDAEFSARTLSGSIESDFPLELGSSDRRRGRDDDDDDDDDGGRVRVHVRIGQEAHGRLGRGGTQLRVNTVSGDISLVRIGR